MSDGGAVMYLGRIVENGDWREIIERWAHPSTQALIAAIPHPLRHAPLATTGGTFHIRSIRRTGVRLARTVAMQSPCAGASPVRRLRRGPMDMR